MHPLLSMKKYLQNHICLWLFGLIVPAFTNLAANLYFAEQLKYYSVLLFTSQPSFQSIIITLGTTAIILLVLSSLEDIAKYIFSFFIASVETELKQDFYIALNQTSLKEIQKLHQGELTTRYHTDILQSLRLISHDIRGIIYPIFGLSYLIAVLYSDLRIGLLLTLLGIFIILLNSLFLHKKLTIQKEILHANETFTLNCSNAIHGKISIRQYSAQKVIIQRIDHAAIQLFQKERQEIYLQTLKHLTSNGLANVCIYLLTPFACLLAVNGYLSLPVVIFIHQVCRYFILHTQNAANAFINYKTHTLSYQRIQPIISLPNEYHNNPIIEKTIFPLNPILSFEQVCISYGEHLVLKNATFTVSPGEIVGLTGESGSGKSSLYKALLQFIAYEGKISIGGINCTDIPLSTLREHISLSPEHNELFHTTVYENIRYGNPNATDREILSIMQKVAISEIPLFLQYNVGKNGCHLSGGQKQKVSLARALLKNAPIFIFDEPTAALDAKSEEVILDIILKLKKEGKCILLISHKRSTLQIADKILSIKNGTIL